jgi:hypothetical protein
MLYFQQVVSLSLRRLGAICGPERAARYLNLLVAFTLLVFAPFVAAAQEGSGIHTVMSASSRAMLRECRQPSLELVG